MMGFSACPTWWVRQDLLKTAFPGGKKTGASIAGLKCLIAISLNANYYTKIASISFGDLESITGLSKPMVALGIGVLESARIINITKGYRNTYELTRVWEDEYFAQLPNRILRKELSSIPNRGKVSLFALKLYFQLLADRPNHSNQISMSYDTIQKKVGTQPRDIKPSIDVLFIHGLISVSRSLPSVIKDEIVYKSNEYTIKGFQTNY